MTTQETLSLALQLKHAMGELLANSPLGVEADANLEEALKYLEDEVIPAIQVHGEELGEIDHAAEAAIQGAEAAADEKAGR
ncbi:hypothetical protein [Methylobacterium oryzae]|uniref:hypothetical protein n=1 Tax=Methylobacterium oryzae TaxID=334852 RepID=UPI002F35BB17